ncbi:MAG TPA: endonuclease/exonuclease/phosphatase family protein [Actinomycetes bacterium]|nr:endonuclease/exonuclease/phosphatase family protein [Actinomycetes bacterium]
MRVATFNLLHGLALDDGSVRADALRAAARTLDVDLLALQEVDLGQERSGGVDQTALVAEELGARSFCFAPAVLGTPGDAWTAATSAAGEAVTGPAYGIGLVSRLPVRRWWLRRFPPARLPMPLLVPDRPRPRLMVVEDEPRVALAALVDGPHGPFTVVGTHLSFVPGVNLRQLRSVARWVARMPAPVLLLGDLNLPGRLPSLATGWRELGGGATYPSFSPRVQFDHVLAHGLPPGVGHHAEVLRLPVSDHCAMRVWLETD